MTDYSYGEFTPEHLTKMKYGVKLFNQEKFFECHEMLEKFWLEDAADEARNVYWVLIQVAAALHHVQNDNITGARSLITKAIEKADICEKKGVETALLDKYLQWSEFKSIIRAIPTPCDKSDFDRLLRFKFEQYL